MNTDTKVLSTIAAQSVTLNLPTAKSVSTYGSLTSTSASGAQTGVTSYTLNFTDSPKIIRIA